jgi:hypothetical protein
LEIKELVLTLDKDHRPGLTINWGSKTSKTWVKKSTLNSSQICPLYEFLQHFNNVFEIKCLDTIIDMILWLRYNTMFDLIIVMCYHVSI